MNVDKNVRLNLIKLCGNPNENIQFKNVDEQKSAELYFEDWCNRLEIKRQKLSDSAKQRFSGHKWSEESRLKLSKSRTGIKKDPAVVERINKNPEKIRKTAEKHRGMKRSDESKAKMSLAKKGKDAKNKGTIRIKMLDGSVINWPKDTPLPIGTRKHTTRRAIDTDGNIHYFDVHENLPEGWSWVKK